MDTKTCEGKSKYQCGKTKPVSEFTAGRNQCKTCKAEYSRDRWKGNPELQKGQNARRKVRRDTDPEYAELEKIRSAIYRMDNRKGRQEASARFRAENPEYAEEYRRKNAEKISEYTRKRWERFKENHIEALGEDCPCEWCYYSELASLWGKENPERRAALSANRRARVRNAPSDGSLTADVWSRLRMGAEFCITCGSEFDGRGDRTQGHVVPITKGGHHSVGNVIVQCKSCNSRQHARVLGDWTPPRDLGLVVSDLKDLGVKIPIQLERACQNAR